jgi:pentatricopeptide repeat protein
MLPESGLTPDANHFASLVEAWARNGRMDKAEQWLRRAAEQSVDDQGQAREHRSKALRAFISFCDQQLVGDDKDAAVQRARKLFADK